MDRAIIKNIVSSEIGGLLDLRYLFVSHFNNFHHFLVTFGIWALGISNTFTNFLICSNAPILLVYIMGSIIDIEEEKREGEDKPIYIVGLVDQLKITRLLRSELSKLEYVNNTSLVILN